MGTLAWQGIRLEFPSRWSPIKLEGDFRRGYLLMADLLRPRLGLRWHTPPRRKLDARKLVHDAMLEEVGQLAAGEAEETSASNCEYALLYVEPEPPGRDVWIGFSRTSGRIIQVAYHAHRREHLLAQTLLPTLADLAEHDPQPWAVFDLSCRIPRNLPLAGQQLNAGDLTLTFGAAQRWVSVRQIAVARVALSRRPLEQWLQVQQKLQRKRYRPGGQATAVSVPCGSRQLHGLMATMPRRRRFALAWKIARQLITMALHDEPRDRILILQGTGLTLVRQIAKSLSWAADESAKAVPDRP